jgi:hypothetical protein
MRRSCSSAAATTSDAPSPRPLMQKQLRWELAQLALPVRQIFKTKTLYEKDFLSLSPKIAESFRLGGP